jgi:hypothetical protein
MHWPECEVSRNETWSSVLYSPQPSAKGWRPPEPPPGSHIGMRSRKRPRDRWPDRDTSKTVTTLTTVTIPAGWRRPPQATNIRGVPAVSGERALVFRLLDGLPEAWDMFDSAIAFERHRLEVVRRWPDSAVKDKLLASIECSLRRNDPSREPRDKHGVIGNMPRHNGQPGS